MSRTPRPGRLEARIADLLGPEVLGHRADPLPVRGGLTIAGRHVHGQRPVGLAAVLLADQDVADGERHGGDVMRVGGLRIQRGPAARMPQNAATTPAPPTRYADPMAHVVGASERGRLGRPQRLDC
jgi:hypothetical protein